MKEGRSIKLTKSSVEIIAYLYIAIPVMLFTMTWLRAVFAVLFTSIIIGALFFAARECRKRNQDEIQIPVSFLIILLAVAFLWTISSGVGGLYPQQADWNWRNAILHDLINYSWPVIYPETDQGLVYYLSYFLLPALAGKAFGWGAANAVILLWTGFGISLAFLLLVCYFKPQTVRKLLVILLVFIVWREFDGIREALCGIFNADWAYEFTDFNGLLQWVTNQTVVPWVAVLLFLNDRDIQNYAFLGLLLLASAPLPFVGLFLLLAADGLYQLRRDYRKDFPGWLRNVLSPQNILAIIGILPVFALYYSANSAASGDSGRGGINIYIGQTKEGIISLVLFWIFNSLAFAFMVAKDHRKDFLFYVTAASLLLIPVIQVGEGRDFCMRASIPAVTLMMVYTLQYLFDHYREGVSARIALIIGALGVFTGSFLEDTLNRTSEVAHADSRSVYQAEAVGSLAIRLPYTEAYGSYLNMYLTGHPYDQTFYKLLAKTKSSEETERETAITNDFLKSEGFEFISGHYRIVLAFDPSVQFGNDTVLGDTTISGKYEIYESDTRTRYVASRDDSSTISATVGGVDYPWATNDIPQNQLYSIVKKDNAYMVIWQDDTDYALTYENGSFCFEKADGRNSQLWKIEQTTE